MIQKLQRRFVVTAGIAVIIVLASVIAVINSTMRIMMSYQVSQVLNQLLLTGVDDNPFSGNIMLSNHYFLVWLDENNNIVDMDLSHEIMLESSDAQELVEEALHSGNTSGQLQADRVRFAYRIGKLYAEEEKTYTGFGNTGNADSTESEGTNEAAFRIAFLNITATVNTIHELLWLSIIIGLLSWIGFVIIFILLSSRAIAPVVKNMEAQKRFITNASHELKTPIAIISANTELLEAMNGENEWTRNTMTQTERLTGLINELVTLSKVSELDKVELQDLDFSAIVEAGTEEIRPVLTRQEKTLTCQIAKEVHVKGEPRFLRMLVSIFLDNAAKYCDEKGTVTVELQARSRERGAVLTVANDYAEGADVDYSRFFERFYQQDESHNSKKGGFGIGLSNAQEIVRMMKGSIKTEYAEGRIYFRITLPGEKRKK